METSIYQHSISYSLAYDAADVMNNDNLASALSAQIQMSILLIGTVRTPSVEPIVLAYDGALPLRKLRRLNKPELRDGLDCAPPFIVKTIQTK